MVGDQFLVRGYENGKHFATREKFYPTLFVPSKKKTKYQTLNGEYVESVEPGSVRDCREFIKRYDGVENFKIYGNEVLGLFSLEKVDTNLVNEIESLIEERKLAREAKDWPQLQG